MNPQLILVGGLLAALIAAAGYATRALTVGGAFGAFVVGTVTFGVGGPLWGLLLVVFFVSSSLLSEWQSGAKAEIAREIERGTRRDLVQVAANGGVPALLALAQAAVPDVDLFPLLVGAVAAVTADTWATEVGLTSQEPPRLITTGQTVPPGTSGAVTVLGSGAAAAAGALVGLTAALLVLSEAAIKYRLLDLSGAGFLLLAPAAAVAGAAFDSWLGATIQAVRRCEECGVETERRTHHCGSRTIHVRGWRLVDNDVVNALTSLIGAAVSGLLCAMLW